MSAVDFHLINEYYETFRFEIIYENYQTINDSKYETPITGRFL